MEEEEEMPCTNRQVAIFSLKQTRSPHFITCASSSLFLSLFLSFSSSVIDTADFFMGGLGE